MDRSPCLECNLLDEPKNNPTCEACGKVKTYTASLGHAGGALPMDQSDMVSKKRSWSDDEDTFLKGNIGKFKNRELGNHLNRSEGAIAVRLNSLGVKRSRKQKAEVRKKSKVKNEENKNKSSNQNDKIIKIDFTDYPGLLDSLTEMAHENFRPIENEILYLIREAAQKIGE